VGVIVAWPVLMVCVVLIVGGVMVKQEHDREDLLRDGKQMTARAEAVMDDVVVVIGFRPNSQVSFYFGQDPVFQFNTARELRRVFHQGRSYAAIEGKLCELTRQRQGGRLTLVSQVIPANLEEMIFELFDSWVVRIQVALESTETVWTVVGEERVQFLERLTIWIANAPASVVIAQTPNA